MYEGTKVGGRNQALRFPTVHRTASTPSFAEPVIGAQPALGLCFLIAYVGGHSVAKILWKQVVDEDIDPAD